MSVGEGKGSIPWRERTVYLLVGIAMLAPLDVPLVGPALPVVAEAFGISSARAGLVITAYALPGVVMGPVIGVLADRFGRKRVLVPCLLVYGLAGVSVLLVSELLLVLVLRFVQGSVGGSILASLAMTIAGDVYAGARRNAVMGLISAATTVTAAVAPGVGGALATVSWDAPFGVYALSVGVGVVALLLLREPELESTAGGMSLAYLREAIEAVPVRPVLATYAATLGGFTLIFGGLFTAVTFLLSGTYGLGSGRIGAFVTASLGVAVVVSLLNGRFARYASNAEMIALGFIGYGAGLFGVGLAGSTVGVLAALSVFGVGHGLALPSILSALSALSPDRYRGGVMSLRTSLVLASQAIGPPLFTLAAPAYDPPLLAAGVLAALAGAIALAVVRWRHRPR